MWCKACLTQFTKILKINKVTIATYIDLSKAFDCLEYKQLFTKMTALGFTKRTLNWFKSYLSKRVQYTEIMVNFHNILMLSLGCFRDQY